MSGQSILKIDAHHHFWHYSPEAFPWITPERMVVGRDFLPDEFANVLQAGGIDRSILIQNFRTLEETDWLLECGQAHPWIEAVVGWFPLLAPDLEATLERYAHLPEIVGAREILQYPEVRPYFEDVRFHRGLDLLAQYGLSYDLLIAPDQMAASIQLADTHPDLSIALCHMGKPPIASGDLSAWARDFRELAKRPNVVCKFSGLPLESKIPGWQVSDFQPCIDLALDVFGPERLMFGSDWPPCLMATSYERWVQFVTTSIEGLSTDEQAAIWSGTAQRFYRLDCSG